MQSKCKVNEKSVETDIREVLLGSLKESTMNSPGSFLAARMMKPFTQNYNCVWCLNYTGGEKKSIIKKKKKKRLWGKIVEAKQLSGEKHSRICTLFFFI